MQVNLNKKHFRVYNSNVFLNVCRHNNSPSILDTKKENFRVVKRLERDPQTNWAVYIFLHNYVLNIFPFRDIIDVQVIATHNTGDLNNIYQEAYIVVPIVYENLALAYTLKYS